MTAGVLPVEFEKNEDRSADFKDFLEEVGTQQEKENWRARLRVVALDVRIMGQCQSAVAEAVHSFGRIDILFVCHSEVDEVCLSLRGARTYQPGVRKLSVTFWYTRFIAFRYPS